MRSRRLAVGLLVFAFYALHQDVWFWGDASPLVFGILPVGLFYHAAYTLAVPALMWLLIRAAWPHHLERDHPAEPGVETGTAPREGPLPVEPGRR